MHLFLLLKFLCLSLYNVKLHLFSLLLLFFLHYYYDLFLLHYFQHYFHRYYCYFHYLIYCLYLFFLKLLLILLSFHFHSFVLNLLDYLHYEGFLVHLLLIYKNRFNKIFILHNVLSCCWLFLLSRTSAFCSFTNSSFLSGKQHFYIQNI